MKANIIIFCQRVVKLLQASKNFANDYVYYKTRFFHQFQSNLVFSTRFGADFFSEVEDRVKNNKLIKPEKGEKLGEFDVNFNNWLTQLK
jgi:hypothetical protein